MAPEQLQVINTPPGRTTPSANSFRRRYLADARGREPLWEYAAQQQKENVGGDSLVQGNLQSMNTGISTPPGRTTPSANAFRRRYLADAQGREPLDEQASTTAYYEEAAKHSDASFGASHHQTYGP
jgi:hypothetical protein